MSIVSGVSLKELSQGKSCQVKAGKSALFFVLGFAVCFSILGASSGMVGEFLIRHSRIMYSIAGLLLILMGVALLDVFNMPVFMIRTARFDFTKLKPGYLTSFIAGLAFAFAWTPCLGPVLTSLLIMAAAQETVFKGAALLFVYSLGLGLPFLLITFCGGYFLGKLKHMNRFIKYTQKIMAAIIILIGIIFIIDPYILVNISH